MEQNNLRDLSTSCTLILESFSVLLKNLTICFIVFMREKKEILVIVCNWTVTLCVVTLKDRRSIRIRCISLEHPRLAIWTAIQVFYDCVQSFFHEALEIDLPFYHASILLDLRKRSLARSVHLTRLDSEAYIWFCLRTARKSVHCDGCFYVTSDFLVKLASSFLFSDDAFTGLSCNFDSDGLQYHYTKVTYFGCCRTFYQATKLRNMEVILLQAVPVL